MKRICQKCGNEFDTDCKYRKYCSDKCAKEVRKIQSTKEYRKRNEKRGLICKECGDKFDFTYKHRIREFCCVDCRKSYLRRIRKKQSKEKVRRKEYLKNYEKTKNKNRIEGVSYKKVYERDKGICQICLLPVHMVKGVDNNWDGTIDHIIPISKGGKHCMSNCQLSHRICNSLKQQECDDYKIDWELKSLESNHWKNKYENYKKLMGIKF